MTTTAAAAIWIKVINTEKLCNIMKRCLFSESAAALIAGIKIWRVGIVVSVMSIKISALNVSMRTDRSAAIKEVMITKV